MSCDTGQEARYFTLQLINHATVFHGHVWLTNTPKIIHRGTNTMKDKEINVEHMKKCPVRSSDSQYCQCLKKDEGMKQ